MEQHLFKVFGLQRTGTNLMRALLEHNFHVRYVPEVETGWKHGPLRLKGGLWKGEPVRFVLCVKNPYAWALSCYHFFRRSHGGDPTMAPEFYRDPSMSFEEFLLTPSYGFQSPIHRWNQQNHLWLSTLPSDRTILVKQEDQLQSQIPALEEAERILKLLRRHERLMPIDERVDVDVSLRGAMNRDYYLDHQFLEDYSPTLLAHVNSIIDLRLMQQLGYQPERWTIEQRQLGPLKLYVRPCTNDAADAFEVASDPHRLLDIKHRGEGISSVVLLGSGAGAAPLLVRGLWPQARIIACERSEELLPLLRLNTRGHEQVTVAAASAYPDYLIQLLGGAEEISLLLVEEPQAATGALVPIIQSGMIRRIRYVRARLPSDPSQADLTAGLARTHRVETRTTPSATFLTAERLL